MRRTRIDDGGGWDGGYEYADGRYCTIQEPDGTWTAVTIDSTLERGMWRTLGSGFRTRAVAEGLIEAEEAKREAAFAGVPEPEFGCANDACQNGYVDGNEWVPCLDCGTWT